MCNWSIASGGPGTAEPITAFIELAALLMCARTMLQKNIIISSDYVCIVECMQVLWDSTKYETLLQNSNLSLTNSPWIASEQNIPVSFC